METTPASLEPIELEPLTLDSFTLAEIGRPLALLEPERRAAYEHAARIVGAFTLALPAAWTRVIDAMIPAMQVLARRVLDEQGNLDPALARHNLGTSSPIDPVWLNDRTRPREGVPYMPQRAIFVRLDKLVDVYEDAELVLGFLLKEFARRQIICRHFELLGVPREHWARASGGAVESSWLEQAATVEQTLDELAHAARTSGWEQRVIAAWQREVAACRCWSWASVNFFLYNDGLDLERVPIRPIRDERGRDGFAATLLIEHTDYDLVASVVNDRVGLQARDVDGRWRSVEPGPLLINTGKAMQLLAGDRYHAGEIVGGNMRALPHRVVVSGFSEASVREQLAALQRRISIVGVTEPHGERARLQTWDPHERRLHPAAGLEHAVFWQFLVRKVPPAPADPAQPR